MAILSNINDLFRVDSAGAVYFATSAGANLQVLQSVGTGGSPIWVDVDDIIGGPYLPLAGGTLTGNLALTDATNNPSLVISTGSLTVGGVTTLTGALSGTTATLSGLLTGTTSNFSGLSTLNGGVTMSNSILVSYAGSDANGNDAGLKIMNDGSDWGIYIRKTLAADYGLRIDGGGVNALWISNTIGGSPTFKVSDDGDTAIAGSVNVGLRQAFKPSNFGYSSSYTTLIVGSAGTNYQTNATSLCFNVDVSGNPSGSFNGGGMEYVYRNVGSFITPNASNNGYNTILGWNTSGDVTLSNNTTLNGNVTITGNLFLPTVSSYIKLGGYSFIGEDLIDNDSLTIASHYTESIYFAHENAGVYTTTMRIDRSGKVGIGTGNTTINQALEVRVATGDGILIKSADVATLKMKGGGGVYDWGLATTNLAASDFGIYKSNAGGGDPISAGTAQLYFKNLTNNMTQVGIGASGADVDGKLDLRMNFLGQNWIPDGTSAKWSEVWCNTGTPGTYFNDTMLHLNTNRGGGATGGVVGIAFSPGWGGHQNWGIYSYNTTGSAYTSGDLSFVSQINGGDRFERMRLNGVNGCVGIGIDTTPNSNVKLRVVGDFANEWTAEVKSTNTTGQAYGLVVNTLAGAGVYNLGCYTHTGNGFFVQNDGKVAIGTGTATEGRLHVTQSYSASLRTGYFQSSAYSAPHVVYDTFAINQQDVPSLVLVETPAAAVSTHQKLSITVGDNNCVFRTSQVSGGMWFNVNGGISAPGYQTTSGTNALRILNNGNVGIGNTSPQTTLHVGTTTTVTNQFTNQVNASNFLVNGNANGGASFFQCKTAAVNINMMGNNDFACNQFTFYHKPLSTSQNVVGTIATFSSSTQYNTTSDYRLKENIIPLSDSIIRLKKLKPSRFNFIEDPERIMDGFLAHEVQDIVPEAVNGEKDAVDKNGNEVHQGIDQAKLVPLLVAAIQELEARVKELENK